MSIRRKLVLISLVLIASVGIVGGWYLEDKLRERISARIEAELVRQARLVRESVYAARDHRPDNLDALADRLGGSGGDRVTFIGPDGRLLGDSTLPVTDLGVAETPLVNSAIGAIPDPNGSSGSEQAGKNERYATTRIADSLFVAVPVLFAQGTGAVRVSRPLADVELAAARLRRLLLIAGILGLGLAVFMSVIASRLMSRNLRQMTARVRDLASAGKIGSGERLDVAQHDDVGQLAGSINRMADYLQSTVAALASERERFGAVLQDLPNAVIRLDDERRIRIMNQAAQGLLDLDEAPIGEPFIEYVRAPAVLELLDQLDERGTTEFSLPGPERRLITVHASAPPGDAGYIMVMRDVTDVRQLETVRQDFVANVSHELRTPVSIIRANAETLIDGAMNDPVHGERLVSAVHRNAERLSNIINELLDLSRLEASRFHLQLQEMSVLVMAERAIDTVERAAQGKDITVHCEIDDDVTLRTDPQMCERILINYLDNAIKYTPAGGHIRVRTHTLDEQVRLEVIDNGPGISEQHRKRVFERFYRIDPGRSRSMGGTGLGLSIVKHAGELLGGTVGVDAVEPHGSRFWVALPLSREAS